MTVLIVDDHPVVRQGLRVLLDVHDGIDVTGEAADGAEALAMAAEQAPDVILLDLKLPGLDGIAVLRELRARGTTSRVLVLTSGNDPTQVSLALRSGASGFLYKDVGPGRAGPGHPRRPRREHAARPRRGGLAGAIWRRGARARRLVRGPAARLGRPGRADRPRA